MPPKNSEMLETRRRDALQGRQEREFQLSIRGKREDFDQGDHWIFSAVISSDAPVEFYGWEEVLQHDESALDLEAVGDGRCMLLDGHRGQPVGKIEEIEVRNNKAYATIKMIKTGRSNELAEQWLQEIATNLSVGYDIIKYENDHEAERCTITRWKPLEVSVVGIPADKNAGVHRRGRSGETLDGSEKEGGVDEGDGDDNNNPIETPPTEEDDPMPQPTDPKPAEVTPTPTPDPIDYHGGRQAIREDLKQYAEKFNITDDQMVDIREEAIAKFERDGDVDGARAGAHQLILDALAERDDSGVKKVDISPEKQAEEVATRGHFGPVDFPRMFRDAKIEGEFNASVIIDVARKRNTDTKITGLLAEYQREMQLKGALPDGVSDAAIPLPADLRVRAAIRQAWRNLPRHERALSITGDAGGKGGHLLETNIDYSRYQDWLYSSAMLDELGATSIMGLVGNLKIPRQTSKPTAVFVTESAAVASSDFTIGHVTLEPHRVGAYIPYTVQSVAQTPGNTIGDLTMDNLAKIIMEVKDDKFLNGTGVNPEPLGILKTTGLPAITHGTNGGAVTFAKWNQITRTLKENEIITMIRTLTTPGIEMHRKGTFQDPNGGSAPIWPPSVINTGLYYTSNLLPTNGTKGTGTSLHTEISGDWSECIMAEWGDYYLIIDPYSEKESGEVELYAQCFVDIALRRVKAFVISNDITAL